MGLYTREDQVKIRVVGKVRFSEDGSDENRMSLALLRRLINEAEGEVELDLSERYAAPFQTDAGMAFQNLPDRPTKEVLRTMCEHKAVMRVLETDYGSGGTVDASKYLESISKRYDALLKKLVGKREDHGEATYKQWVNPPLPGLMLAAGNEAADDGYAGQVLVTSEFDSGDYPAKQINNPSQNFWNGVIDE